MLPTWLSTLVGGGSVAGIAVGLVLWGKLLPAWQVNRDRTALVASFEKAAQAVGESHQNVIDGLKGNHVDALALRDREVERLVQERDYERQAKDIERGRADANAERVSALAHELGEQSLHLLRALPEAAGRDQ